VLGLSIERMLRPRVFIHTNFRICADFNNVEYNQFSIVYTMVTIVVHMTHSC
jgi:hypothetical protein